MGGIELVGTIINGIFLLFLVITIAKGFFKGFWKSIRSLIGLVVGIILLLILLNPLANGVAKINVPGMDGSLNDVIVQALSDALVDGATIKEGSELYILCNSISLSVVKIIVIMVGVILIMLIVEPIVKLILRLLLGKDEHKKTLGVRFGGLGIGLAHFLIVTFILTLPLYGLSSLVLNYKNEIANMSGGEQVEVIEVVETIDNTIPNAINKIFGKNFTINTLGSLSKVKNENGTLNIIKEVNNLQPLVAVVIEAQGEDGIDFLSLLVNSKDDLVYFIENTNLFETMMPAVIEMLELKGTFDDSSIKIEDLKQIDFKHDKKNIAAVIEVLADFVEETNLDLDNPKQVLNNENLPVALKTLGEALQDSTFLDMFLGILQNVLNEATAGNDLGELSQILNITNIEKEFLANDLYQVGVLANSLAELGILDGNMDNILSKPDSLKKMLNAILDLSLVKGKESTILASVLDMIGFKEAFTNLGMELNFNNINWNEERVVLGNIIDEVANAHKNISDFELTSLATYIKDSNKHQYISPLLKALSKSAIFDFTFIVDIIEKELTSYGITSEINKDNLPTTGNWDNEIDCLLTVVGLSSDIDAIINDYHNRSSELGKLLNAVYSSTILKPIGKELLNDIIGQTGLAIDISTFDMDQVVSWEYEIQVLIKLETELENFDGEITSLGKEKVEQLIIVASGTSETPCYIGSFIVGTFIQAELQTILTEESYNNFINTHNLTNPSVLRESASDITSVVELSKLFNNIDNPENLNKETITELCDIYANLDTSNSSVTNSLVLEVVKSSDIDLTEEEFENVSFEAESAYLEEVLTAHSNNATDEELEALIKKAEEETVIAIAIINKYFR